MALGSIREWVEKNPDEPFIFFLLFVCGIYSLYRWIEIIREIKEQPRVVGPRYSQGEKKHEAAARILSEYAPVDKIKNKAWIWSFVFWCDVYVALPDLDWVDISKIPFLSGVFIVFTMTIVTNIAFMFVVNFGLRKEDANPPE